MSLAFLVFFYEYEFLYIPYVQFSSLVFPLHVLWHGYYSFEADFPLFDLWHAKEGGSHFVNETKFAAIDVILEVYFKARRHLIHLKQLQSLRLWIRP